jgi:hypothetical protein
MMHLMYHHTTKPPYHRMANRAVHYYSTTSIVLIFGWLAGLNCAWLQ